MVLTVVHRLLAGVSCIYEGFPEWYKFRNVETKFTETEVPKTLVIMKH